MTFGDSPPPGWPPNRSSGTQSALWMLAALIVVVAAGVTIAVVLAGGRSSPDSQGAGPPTTPRTTSPSSGSPSPAPTGGAPTTDVLPDNPQSATCASTVTPDLVAVGLVSYLGLVRNGRPDANTQMVFDDCVNATVRGRLAKLYRVQFGVDYSADLTGGSDKGATARYSVQNRAGTATLTLTLTRQEDQHYELTGIAYG